jgi:hypothetical protein
MTRSYVQTREDGAFPVFVDYDDAGAPRSIRIELRP